MHTTPNRQTAPKHVLISVVGLSPQVITETLYCCWCLASPPIPITEVFALTTLRGKQALEETLLGDNGKLKSLQRLQSADNPLQSSEYLPPEGRRWTATGRHFECD